MSNYQRVLPRDAFNEANLLKCIGFLTMAVVDGVAPKWKFEHDNEAFDVVQNPEDGSITVRNIEFEYGGEPVHVFRPLNSREPWPLMAQLGDEEPFPVFTSAGTLL